MDLLNDIYPSYARLVTRCERTAIRESKARADFIDFGDPWYVPHTDTFHYSYLNQLLTERLIEVFIQRYTTASLSSIRHYHDQFSTGKVMVRFKVKDKGRFFYVGMEVPRLIMSRPVWYPNYHSPKAGYWRGAISDIIHLRACGFIDTLRTALYRYLKPNEGFASLDEQIEHDTLCFMGFSPEDVRRWHQEDDRSPEEMEEFKRMMLNEFPVTQHTQPNRNNRLYRGSTDNSENVHVRPNNENSRTCGKVEKYDSDSPSSLLSLFRIDTPVCIPADPGPKVTFARAKPTALGGYLPFVRGYPRLSDEKLNEIIKDGASPPDRDFFNIWTSTTQRDEEDDT